MTEERASNDRNAPNTESTEDIDRSMGVFQSEWPEFDYPSTAVIEAVATATNASPLDLAPLNGVLDPDALDELLLAVKSNSKKDVRVSFRYEDSTVLVEGNGALTISIESKSDE